MSTIDYTRASDRDQREQMWEVLIANTEAAIGYWSELEQSYRLRGVPCSDIYERITALRHSRLFYLNKRNSLK